MSPIEGTRAGPIARKELLSAAGDENQPRVVARSERSEQRSNPGACSGALCARTASRSSHPDCFVILALHGDDPEEAILRAVNDTRDNDTIAAIVGAAVGALHGRSVLPERWLAGLTGRTGCDDDGKVFELVERGLARFAMRE
jgi:ADP-ribosylglycohydrolase